MNVRWLYVASILLLISSLYNQCWYAQNVDLFYFHVTNINLVKIAVLIIIRFPFNNGLIFYNPLSVLLSGHMILCEIFRSFDGGTRYETSAELNVSKTLSQLVHFTYHWVNGFKRWSLKLTNCIIWIINL